MGDARLDPRNRIGQHVTDHPFDDYWDVFVYKHRDPRNLAAHCVGVVMMHAGLWGALALGNPWLLGLIPASQVLGLLGHWCFEQTHIDARDAVFSWRATNSLNRMFVAVARGRYGAEVRRVEEALAAHLARRAARPGEA